MGRGTKTTEFLKMCLSDALVELMEEKPFENITIDEITSTAGVGRATYFRNFRSKDELLSFKMETLLKTWYKKQKKSMNVAEGMRWLLDFFYENKDFFLTICRDIRGAEIMNNLSKGFFPQFFKRESSYQEAFYYGGVISVIDKWFRGGLRETPSKLMDIFASLGEGQESIENLIIYVETNSETGKLEISLKATESAQP